MPKDCRVSRLTVVKETFYGKGKPFQFSLSSLSNVFAVCCVVYFVNCGVV